MKTKLVWVFLLFSCFGNAQLVDDFSDGNFSANPAWTGTSADFIVNTSSELQTNVTAAATSYLSVPHTLTTLNNKEWRMRVKMTFSPSSSNFGRIYLTSNTIDPTTNPDGFYIQLGEAGATDAVKLFKQETGISTLICSGATGAISASFNFGIKVTRDISGLWSLSTDALGGTNYVFQSSGTETTALLGTFFSWQCTYTVSNINKFFLDDIYVGNIVVDNSPPVLISATAISATSVDVLFNEPLNPSVAQDINNYDIQPFISAISAVLDGSDPKLVHLTTSSALTNGSSYNLIVPYMEDVLGNDTSNQSVLFIYFIPEVPVPGDVIINEFFPDPTPVVGLPELEFVEIYNRSTKYFDLAGWKIGDASAEGTIQTSILAPGEYKVLCATSSVPSFSNSVAVTSFPSLNNTGDGIVLKDDNGIELDKISYTDDWYQDNTKKEGGYSLERINPTLICSASQNWIASANPAGGTPGVQNSVFDNSPDVNAPSLQNVFALAPNVLTLEFNEPLDFASLQTAILSTNPVLTEDSRSFASFQPMSISFLFTSNLTPSFTYSFTLDDVEDCAGNSANLSGTFILPDNPSAGDVVINEILFDPLTGGSDYVELYNASDKVFDLFEWKLANIANDSIANEKEILEHRIIFPGGYIAITKDILNVVENYPAAIENRIIQSELPSYNNDSGTVILKTDFVILDKVSYLDDWHFALLDSKDGKALERINALDGSNNPSNWHTAAEAIGFGTPGAENSQFVPQSETGEFNLVEKVFSPDNDGFQDVLQIRYSLAENELLGSIQIFDDQGRLVRKLIENEYLGTEGLYTWDGVNDSGTKASIGQYIIVFEAFQPTGGVKYAARKVGVLAGKL